MAILAVVVLAGCAAPAPEPAPTEAAPTPPASPLDPSHLEFTGCIGASTAFTFPGPLGPGRPVPGWPEPQAPASEVLLRLARCDRMRWGPFERPVTLMYEMHDRLAPDPGCTDDLVGKPGSLLALHAMWFDDAEVAAWANATFGMPTRAANFTVTASAASEAAQWTWRWVLPDGEASEVTFRHANATKQGGPYLQRMAWRADGVLHLLDLHEDLRGDRAQAALTPGTMGPTMLYREAAPAAYGGHGDQLDGLGLAGALQRFEDMACAKPA